MRGGVFHHRKNNSTPISQISSTSFRNQQFLFWRVLSPRPHPHTLHPHAHTRTPHAHTHTLHPHTHHPPPTTHHPPPTTHTHTQPQTNDHYVQLPAAAATHTSTYSHRNQEVLPSPDAAGTTVPTHSVSASAARVTFAAACRSPVARGQFYPAERRSVVRVACAVLDCFFCLCAY
jgi:hypothetical protein